MYEFESKADEAGVWNDQRTVSCTGLDAQDVCRGLLGERRLDV
jgi:hypothetical protein